MPMDRSLYPKNWEEIALQVKEQANWTCQECGRPCRKAGENAWALYQLKAERLGQLTLDLEVG